jgi:hypothetical protein
LFLGVPFRDILIVVKPLWRQAPPIVLLVNVEGAVPYFDESCLDSTNEAEVVKERFFSSGGFGCRLLAYTASEES